MLLTPPYCLHLASDRPLPRQRDITASHTLSIAYLRGRVAQWTCWRHGFLFFSRDLGGWSPWSSI